MAYVRLKGCEMQVYVPDGQAASEKKHNCRDCFSCQWCSDERCRACLNRKNTACRRNKKR